MKFAILHRRLSIATVIAATNFAAYQYADRGGADAAKHVEECTACATKLKVFLDAHDLVRVRDLLEMERLRDELYKIANLVR